MAAQLGSGDDEEQYRRRKLAVVDGRLSLSDAADLSLFIRSVPSGQYQLELTHLVLNAVSLQHITKEMCLLTNLTRLECSENELTQIPPEINKLVSLTHLDVSRNQITHVPLSMLTMTSLCVLSVKDNVLAELPQLNALPSFTTLKANRNHLHLGRLPPGLTAVMKSFGAQHVPSEIEPGLYLGSYISAQNLTALQALRITHILTVARETPPAFPDKFEYRHIKEDDLPSVDLSKYFDEMADYIAKGKAAGGVLVHCRQGISRSATAVAAYLIKKRAISYDGALDWLRIARQCVNPNSGFRKQLRNLYRECRRLRNPPLPGAPEVIPEPIAEAEEEQSEEKHEHVHKEKKEKKDKKERRSSREVKTEEIAAEAAKQVPELVITGDPRKQRSHSTEERSKYDKKEKKDKERKQKSGSQIHRKDKEASDKEARDKEKEREKEKEKAKEKGAKEKEAKERQVRDKERAKALESQPETTIRSVETAVDFPPPPCVLLPTDSIVASSAAAGDEAALRRAIENEVRAKLRAEIEAEVKSELEAKWAKECMEREAKIRSSLEAEVREEVQREMQRAPHTVIELPAPTDENDPLLAKTKTENQGFCSWCSIV